jgi:hypothetical protein
LPIIEFLSCKEDNLPFSASISKDRSDGINDHKNFSKMAFYPNIYCKLINDCHPEYYLKSINPILMLVIMAKDNGLEVKLGLYFNFF